MSKNIELEELMKNTSLKQLDLEERAQLVKKLQESEKTNIVLVDKLEQLEKFRDHTPSRLEVEKYIKKSREEYLAQLKEKNSEVEKLKLEILNLETKLKHRDEMIRELQNEGSMKEEWREILSQKNKTI